MNQYLVILHDVRRDDDGAREALKRGVQEALLLTIGQLEEIFADLPAIVAKVTDSAAAAELCRKIESAGGLAEVVEEECTQSPPPPHRPHEKRHELPSAEKRKGTEKVTSTQNAVSDDPMFPLEFSFTETQTSEPTGLEERLARAEREEFVPLDLGGETPPSLETTTEEKATAPTPIFETDTGPPLLQSPPSVNPVPSHSPPPAPAIDQGIEEFTPKMRHRRSIRSGPPILIWAGLAIAGSAFVILLLYGFTSEQSPGLDTQLVSDLVDQQRRGRQKRDTAPPPVRRTREELPRLEGVHPSHRVAVRVLGEKDESFSLDVDWMFPAPRPLTAEEIVAGRKQLPWLERATGEDVKGDITWRDETQGGRVHFQVSAPGKAYIDDNGLKSRVPIKLVIKGEFDVQKSETSLRWVVTNTENDHLMEWTAEVTRLGTNSYRVRHAGSSTINGKLLSLPHALPRTDPSK